MAPGGVFVVAGAVGKAAVEDANKTIPQGSEGLVVKVAGGSALVVVGPASRAGREGAEGGALVDGVVEPAVADVAARASGGQLRLDRVAEGQQPYARPHAPDWP
jgi:hypothetical protein